MRLRWTEPRSSSKEEAEKPCKQHLANQIRSPLRGLNAVLTPQIQAPYGRSTCIAARTGTDDDTCIAGTCSLRISAAPHVDSLTRRVGLQSVASLHPLTKNNEQKHTLGGWICWMLSKALEASEHQSRPSMKIAVHEIPLQHTKQEKLHCFFSASCHLPLCVMQETANRNLNLSL